MVLHYLYKIFQPRLVKYNLGLLLAKRGDSLDKINGTYFYGLGRRNRERFLWRSDDLYKKARVANG